ncbi:MAG TPA: hypothetical protein VFH84_11465, partial [Amycolatopsis sp.]|nr:hypothetical protein [Amycolatopsis sp.]
MGRPGLGERIPHVQGVPVGSLRTQALGLGAQGGFGPPGDEPGNDLRGLGRSGAVLSGLRGLLD